MERSKSCLMEGNTCEAYRAKCIYINEPTEKKDVATIFHSPYKNGRRDHNYSNPSFMSSDIFYPQSYCQPTHKETTPKKAIVQVPSDIRKQELYNRRMTKSQSYNYLKAYNDISKENCSGNTKAQGKSFINDKKSHEFSAIQRFRNINEWARRQEKEGAQRKQKAHGMAGWGYEVPVYLEKNKQSQEMNRERNKLDLKRWIGISQEIQNLKKGLKAKAKISENSALLKTNERLRAQYARIDERADQKSKALASFLKEQIIIQNDKKKALKRGEMPYWNKY